MKRPATFTISALFFLTCLCILILTIVMIVMGMQSKKYESTTGTVTISEVETYHCIDLVDSLGYYSPTCANINMSYLYTIDDIGYRSEKVSYGDPGLYRYLILPERLEDIIEPYPVDEEVEVFYNPSDPDQAVLEVGVDPVLNYVLGAFILLCLVTAAIFWGQFTKLVKVLE